VLERVDVADALEARALRGLVPLAFEPHVLKVSERSLQIADLEIRSS
jgi:hypothetical protein